MEEKRLIVVVDSTAAMASHWHTIVTEYLLKIIRSFCDIDACGKKHSVPNFELALIKYNSYEAESACLVQRSGWTRDSSAFMQWLSVITFSGGGFGDAAIAEGLAEALMMFSVVSNGNQTPQNACFRNHCVLIAGSNPCPFSMRVYRPTKSSEQSGCTDSQRGSPLADVKTVANFFPMNCISLSVIFPKKLSKLRALFDAGKYNPQAADQPIDDSQYLVLVSQNFMEACYALGPPGFASLQSFQISVNIAPPSFPSGKFSHMNQQQNPAANQAVQGGIGISLNPTTNGISLSITPSENDTMKPSLGTTKQVQRGIQYGSTNMNGSTKVPLSLHAQSDSQRSQSKFVKFWEGSLYGVKNHQSIYLTNVKGYKSSASVMLGLNWPSTLTMARLQYLPFMTDKQNAGIGESITFRADKPNSYLRQMRESNLCGIVDLLSHTLLLSVSEDTCSLQAIVYPEVRFGYTQVYNIIVKVQHGKKKVHSSL